MESRFSSSSSASTYSHLLYLNDHERACYLSGGTSPKPRQESMSFFSMTSSRVSSDSERSDMSEISTSCTGDFSIFSAKIPVEKFAENHYPLITSLDPAQSLNLKNMPQKHFAFTVARHMVAIHNSIIRALNSSYNHALRIDAATQPCYDFLRFNQIMFQMLDHHHKMEEGFLSSAFEQSLNRLGPMRDNLRARKPSLPGLRNFQRFIFDPLAAQNYDGDRFRQMIEEFAPELIQRLHNEIPALLCLREMASHRVRKIWSHAVREAKHDLDPYVSGPFVLGCQDRDFQLDGETIDGYPGFPWITETVLRKWYARKHAGVWEFLPSDLYGVRRTIIV